MRPAAAPPELHAPPAAEAVAAWARACSVRAPRPPETVGIDQALGRVTVAPVRALRSSPAFPAAAMDGIAVRAQDVACATSDAPVQLASCDFGVVDTGDPLPCGRDTVIPHERIEFERGAARVASSPARGAHVRAVGEDLAAGELLLMPGRRLGPLDLALLAAAGHAELAVHPRATVSILPTGDELRPPGVELAIGELADTNSIMLHAQAREAGCRTLRRPILPDDPDRLADAVRRAAAESDLVLVIAGTSAGRHDHGLEVLRRCGRVVVRGVAIRPGHPAVLAVVDGTPVMGCPGYPVSAALAFDELARPLLDRMNGIGSRERPGVTARLASRIASRRGAGEHVRVALGSVEGEPVAVPLRRGASVLSSLARADGLVTVPAGEAGLAAGALVRVEALGGAAPRSRALLIAGRPDRALELVLVACAEQGLASAFCELQPADALALVGDRGCHAAWVDGHDAPAAHLEDRSTIAVAVAEREIGLAFAPGNPLAIDGPADLDRLDVRAVAGPAGSKRLSERVTRVRSEATAVATVAAGHADCALAGMLAARAAGLDTLPIEHAPIVLVVRRDHSRRDPSLVALLELLSSPRLSAALAAEGYRPLASARYAA